jgi:hypothetical protein
MGSCIDWLARRRYYRAPIVTVPSVLVIDVPPARRGPGLPLGRYYPIIVETEFERDENARDVDTHNEMMLEGLRASHPISVQMLSANMMPSRSDAHHAEGHAGRHQSYLLDQRRDE